jgi:hypothetical protein
MASVAAGSDIVVRCTPIALDRTLTVLLVAPDGTPAPDVAVGVTGPNGAVVPGMFPTTDDDGRVVFTDLPARSLRISAYPQSRGFLGPEYVDVLPDGQELRLVCRTASRTTGTVVDRAGTAQPHGSVRALRHGEFVASGSVDREGRFVLLLPEADVAPVRVVVDHNNDGAPEATLDDVMPGTEGLRLVLTE